MLMNFRHASALALVGWYLAMLPPKTSQRGPIVFDANAPMNKWEIEGGIGGDTLRECEASMKKLNESWLRYSRGKHGEDRKVEIQSLEHWLSAAKCVSADLVFQNKETK